MPVDPHALKSCADLIKVFPAGIIGGTKYIKAVLAPLPQFRLVPTGGVNAEDAAQYLQAGAVAVAVSERLIDKKVVALGDWAAITAKAKKLVSAVRSATKQATSTVVVLFIENSIFKWNVLITRRTAPPKMRGCSSLVYTSHAHPYR